MAEFDYTVEGIAARALAEDIGQGDITSALSVSANARGRGEFVATEAGAL